MELDCMKLSSTSDDTCPPDVRPVFMVILVLYPEDNWSSLTGYPSNILKSYLAFHLGYPKRLPKLHQILPPMVLVEGLPLQPSIHFPPW